MLPLVFQILAQGGELTIRPARAVTPKQTQPLMAQIQSARGEGGIADGFLSAFDGSSCTAADQHCAERAQQPGKHAAAQELKPILAITMKYRAAGR
jgi:hypothetical protein